MTAISKNVLFRAASCLPAFRDREVNSPETDKKIAAVVSQYRRKGPRVDWSYKGFQNLLGQAYKIGSEKEVKETISSSKYEEEKTAKSVIAAKIFGNLPPNEWELIDLRAETKTIGDGIEFFPPFDLALRQGNRIACVIFCPHSNIALYDVQRDFIVQLLSLPLSGYSETFELHYFEFPKDALGKRAPRYVTRDFQYADTSEIEAHLVKFQKQNSVDEPRLF
ncbi:hypothetical protein [Thalassovita sp.]|uniref:hypothetical protein n=1 Tax=Thalassovita sp. TaxID=1979401 RepID=UPI002B269A4C|nr:hypothetical protein [Thalassovita sp.]